jgi:hypothetical protein
MNKDEIGKAISMSYQEGLMRAYDNREFAVFMFLEGMKFQRTGEVRKDSFKELLKQAGKKEE